MKTIREIVCLNQQSLVSAVDCKGSTVRKISNLLKNEITPFKGSYYSIIESTSSYLYRVINLGVQVDISKLSFQELLCLLHCMAHYRLYKTSLDALMSRMLTLCDWPNKIFPMVCCMKMVSTCWDYLGGSGELNEIMNRIYSHVSSALKLEHKEPGSCVVATIIIASILDSKKDPNASSCFNDFTCLLQTYNNLTIPIYQTSLSKVYHRFKDKISTGGFDNLLSSLPCNPYSTSESCAQKLIQLSTLSSDQQHYSIGLDGSDKAVVDNLNREMESLVRNDELRLCTEMTLLKDAYKKCKGVCNLVEQRDHLVVRRYLINIITNSLDIYFLGEKSDCFTLLSINRLGQVAQSLVLDRTTIPGERIRGDSIITSNGLGKFESLIIQSPNATVLGQFLEILSEQQPQDISRRVVDSLNKGINHCPTNVGIFIIKDLVEIVNSLPECYCHLIREQLSEQMKLDPSRKRLFFQ